VDDILEELSREPEFLKPLQERPPLHKRWTESRDHFRTISRRLGKLRNQIGGHVDKRLGRKLVATFEPGDLLSQEWSRKVGMRGSLPAAFIWLHILGKKFREANGEKEVKALVGEVMEPIVKAHVEGFIALGCFIRLYMIRHQELHLGIQAMPFEVFEPGERK
jgi:hypothetical protein